MCFIDDELQRLKNDLFAEKDWAAFKFTWCERQKLKALIARLEAAEKIAEAVPRHLNNVLEDLILLWRKAAGK